MTVPNLVKLFFMTFTYNLFLHNFVQSTQDFKVYSDNIDQFGEILNNSMNELKQIESWPSYLRNDIKYILLWTSLNDTPSIDFPKGNTVFEQNLCQYRNCYLTEDRKLLPELGEFAAILFHGAQLRGMPVSLLPAARSRTQKYVFMMRDSAQHYPLCDPYYESYFNWTWTYRLDSDLRWARVALTDLHGNQVAPELDMIWSSTYPLISEHIRSKLRSKTTAAAWLVSDCEENRRKTFVKEVLDMLRRYNLTVDVFGNCTESLRCPKEGISCNQIIERDYYFYFALENSDDVDYVTEELLTALDSWCVPVVYGGADYSRFLPPGSYLDGRALGAEQLARTMRDIIQNRTRYEEMFRWRNYYQFEQTSSTAGCCDLCAKLNDALEVSRVSVWEQFSRWWNTDRTWCDSWLWVPPSPLPPPPHPRHPDLVDYMVQYSHAIHTQSYALYHYLLFLFSIHQLICITSS